MIGSLGYSLKEIGVIVSWGLVMGGLQGFRGSKVQRFKGLEV